MTHAGRWLGRALVIGGALGLTSCGGGGGAGASASLPGCANRSFLATKANLLPGTARLYSHRKLLGADVFAAVAPGSLESVRREVEKRLEQEGYTIEGGEVEEHDAEAEFSGQGSSGRVKLRELEGCSGAVQVEVSLR